MADIMTNGYDWDDEIEQDGSQFIELTEGDYRFRVASIERGRFPGSQKTPACYKATLHLEVKTDAGTATVTDDVILHPNFDWKISSFFRAIGMKKHGERMKMNWDKAQGAEGRAHFSTDDYVGKDGRDHTKNIVSRYLDYDDSMMGFVAVPDNTSKDEIPF